MSDTEKMMIPEAAVEAAVMAVALAHAPIGTETTPELWNRLVADVRIALEAAAPHMRREATALRDWEVCPKRHAGQVEHLLDCEPAK